MPYAAGGGSDFLARTVAQGLSAKVGQPVVVDNKPGGNTAIGAAETARASADGYTVLSADNGTMVFNPALYKTLSYQPRDLAPVTLIGRFPMILVVGPGTRATSAQAFIAEVKATPGGINYASAGAGSPHHLAMELFKVEAGLTLTHAPYRGAAPALADVAAGQVPAMMVDYAAGAGFIKGARCARWPWPMPRGCRNCPMCRPSRNSAIATWKPPRSMAWWCRPPRRPR